LKKYHYLGTKGFRSSFIYGLFVDDVLSGVCVFHGVSAPETCVGAFGLERNNQGGIWELGRLAIATELNGGNTTSWFVSRAIKKLRLDDKNTRAIISYADSSAGHLGSIYRACNALYCGMSSQKFDYIDPITNKPKERFKPYEKGTANRYEKRPRPRKHRYVWLFDPTLHLKWKVESCNYNGISKEIMSSIEL
jgi:hypothetical protein